MTLLATRHNSRRASVAPRTLLDDIFGYSPLTAVNFGIEITNTENGFQVEIPVPGFGPEDIAVTLHENILSVEAKNERRKTVHYALTVPEQIDQEAIDVRVEHGMLTLTLTAHPKTQPKHIPVKSGGAPE